jgi:L-alanine-DL-glutamate epimerase-like enolase superfamily enzyme
MTALVLRALTAHVFRAPLATPVVASFGTMRDRPMLIVRAEDRDGAVGFGEVWCNFPAVGAAHRARLVEDMLAPLCVGQSFDDPPQAFARMTAATAVMALQAGEPGPFAQAIAGVDIALWDLAARRAGVPLWKHLGGTSSRIAVYASGLNPDGPEQLAARCLANGHRAFKLKVGFGPARDLANLEAMRATVGDAALMVDANQAWTPAEAGAQATAMERFRLRWLEEPLRCDRPWPEWQALARLAPMPLAAGENIAGDAAFDAALASRALGVLQPDLGKWGGFSAVTGVARRALASGTRFCPHWLGGGVGLLASAHLLAAVGGDGHLEVDANPNPLREATCGALATIDAGHADLGDAPGLGATPDLAALARYAVA